MKKFLKFQLELTGTNESDLTQELTDKLNSDYEKGIGIYNPLFNTPEVVATIKDNTIALQGMIVADTAKECKSIYALLKTEAKKAFVTCKKTSDLMVATGNKIN